MSNSLEHILACIIGAIITVTVHEFAKAFISTSLGDPLPKRDGRLTLNPLQHIELIGLVIMVALGFGWGKPVETASIYYKDRRKGTLITYIAPSVINLLVGVVFVLILDRIAFSSLPQYVYYILNYCALFNLRHAFFNIIPIYPLDGAKVLTALRNPNYAISMVNNQMFYQIILLIFISWGIVARIIDPFCYAVIGTISPIYW